MRGKRGREEGKEREEGGREWESRSTFFVEGEHWFHVVVQ